MMKERLSPMFEHPRPITSFYPKSGIVHVNPQNEHPTVEPDNPLANVPTYLIQRFKEFYDDCEYRTHNLEIVDNDTITTAVRTAGSLFVNHIVQHYISEG